MSTPKDVSYSPSSDRETEERQQSPQDSPATADADIDQDAVTALPGTGGPDDDGEVDVEGEPIDIPRDTGAH
jgi:hypothetical protein